MEEEKMFMSLALRLPQGHTAGTENTHI